MQKREVGSSINPIIREKDKLISKLQKAVELLRQEQIKGNFLSQFMEFLSKNYSYEELLLETTLFFRQEFKSTYAAIFTYNKDKYSFKYEFGTGYKAGLFPTIDESGSVMGEAIHTSDIVIVNNIAERYFYIDLNQTPPEYNVICIPIFTQTRTFVLRIANIPQKENFSVLATVLKPAVLALSKSLEHINQITLNQSSLLGVQVSLSISQLLKVTSNTSEIISKTFKKVCDSFPKAEHIIAVKSQDSFKTTNKSNKDFYLGGTPDAQNVYLNNLFTTFAGGDGYIENIHKEPKWTWPDMNYISINMSPIYLEGKLIGAIISVSKNEELPQMTRIMLNLISDQLSKTIDRAKYFQRQEEFASLDGLTKLFNRRMFDMAVKNECAVAGRYKRKLSIIMFDIDHFKKFNDTYGHKTGDEVLQLVAQVVTSTIRDSDRAFRYGGEEFIILCPETSGKNCALLAERLRERISLARTSQNLQVNISLGVTEFIPGEKPETFAKRVDDLLYHSKENGRNRVTLG